MAESTDYQLEPHPTEIEEKSVSCANIPEIFVLDKSVAKKHFSQFGRIHNLILKPKRQSCTIEYETAAEAECALTDGGYYNGETFDTYYTPKERSKPIPIIDLIDPDVQMELDAMGATRGSYLKSNVAEPIFRKANVASQKLFEPSKKIFARMKTAADTSPSSAMNYQKSMVTTSPKLTVQSARQASTAVDQATKIELENILRKPAYTSEEKYRILDARDKLIRLTTAKTTDLQNVVSTQGVCPDMCPEKERLMREATHHVASYELEDNTKNIMNNKIALKQYARSSADQESPLAHELRPEPVLKMTMNYLLHNIVDLCDSDVNVGDWFHFCWDRTRSIRKDISQQELCSHVAVSLVEQCARLHIHCAARLVAEEPQVFDQKINSENLTKCLQSLKYLYHDLSLKHIQCPNEAEFRAYVILLNLNDCQFFWEVKQLRKDILHSSEIRFAIDVYLAMESNNYVKFFKLVRQTTYMNACILLRYFNQVRVGALNVILKAYVPRGPTTMTISYWQYCLAFEDYEQTAQFMEYYGMQCDRNEDRVVLDRNLYFSPDLPFILERAINIVEHKRTCTVGEAIHGGPLDAFDEFKNYKPHDSFDDQGYLYQESWNAEDQNYLRPPTPKRKVEHPPAYEYDDIGITKSITSTTFTPPSSSAASIFGEQNLFKMPLAPSSAQLKGQQSPKPSIFTKLSPKSDAQTTNSIFGGSTARTSSGSATNSIFGLGSFAAPDTAADKSKNIFQQNSNLFQQSQPTNIFGSMNQKNDENIFGNSKANELQTFTNGSVFGGDQKQPQSEAPKASSIFGGYREKDYGAPKVQKNLNFFNENQSSALTFEIKSSSSVFGGSATASFDDQLLGIAPIASDKAKLLAQHEKRLVDIEKLESEKLKLQEILRQEEAKAKEKRIKEKQLAVQREREERLKQEKLKLLNEQSAEMAECILDDFIKEHLINDATKESEAFEHLELMTQEKFDDIFAELIQEEYDNFLTEKINESILRQYFNKWRISTRKIIERRETIENTPIWIPEKSMLQRAPELMHPLQAATLTMKNRYLQGHANKIAVHTAKDNPIDIFQIIPREILRKRDITERILKKPVYWKCLLSVPDTQEDGAFADRLNKWLSNSFVRRSKLTEGVFLAEQQHNVGICLRKVVGPKLLTEKQTSPNKDDLNGLNGILFFMSTTNLTATRKRLEAVLKSRSHIVEAAGIVMYNNARGMTTEEIKSQLNLNKLLKNKQMCPDYFHSSTSLESLKDLTENCLKFIASNYSFESLMEMQSSQLFLSCGLGDQFWKRLTQSATFNPALSKAVSSVNFVVSIYNEAIHRLQQICRHNDTKLQPQFPIEFRQFVPKNRFVDLPLEYQYFPNDWQDPKRQERICQFLQSLKLKTMAESVQFTSLINLQQHLLDFSAQNISDSCVQKRAGYRMIECVMKYLQQPDEMAETFAQKIQRFSWLESIKLLALEMLALKWQEAVASAGFPCEIIYNRQQWQQFTETFWWLSPNGLLKNIKIYTEQQTTETDVSQTAVSKRPRLQLAKAELDDLIERSRASIERANRKIAEVNKLASVGRHLTRDLDQQLMKQEQHLRVMKGVWNYGLEY